MQDIGRHVPRLKISPRTVKNKQKVDFAVWKYLLKKKETQTFIVLAGNHPYKCNTI